MSNERRERRFLIIDPQEGFHTGGPLAVEGANEDSERIIEMLDANGDAKVYVSLDSHTIKHIGHYDFWEKNVDGREDDSVESLQGLPIEYEEVEENIRLFIRPPDGDKVYIEARNIELRDYAKNYVKTLWSNSAAINLGKVPMLWPTHCVIGAEATGRAIYPPLFEALNGRGNVKYYKKGENELAEMYSIFKSELQPEQIENGKDTRFTAYFNGESVTESGNSTGNVTEQISTIQNGEGEDGEAYLNTEFNATSDSLYSELIKDATQENPVDIYICGEALSHCVNYSLRDLVEKLIDDSTKHVKVHLVLNCSSTVVLELGPKFFGNSVKLIDDILEEYKDYCDIVFLKDTKLIKNEKLVSTTRQIFSVMAGCDGLGGPNFMGENGYNKDLYLTYLNDKLDETKLVTVRVAAAEEAATAAAKGGKRTKKKRHSKTQKKRKGQIKKSKRHRRSRK